MYLLLHPALRQVSRGTLQPSLADDSREDGRLEVAIYSSKQAARVAGLAAGCLCHTLPSLMLCPSLGAQQDGRRQAGEGQVGGVKYRCLRWSTCFHIIRS